MLQNEFDFGLARDFGTALLLGGLIGIEREQRKAENGHGAAGLRTFVLFSQLGAIGGYLSRELGSPWILVATVLAATALVASSYVVHVRQHPESLGLTTEVAAVLVCLFGALVVTGHRELGVGLGVATAAVLAFKQPLHAMVDRLDRDDLLAGLRLLLATFIVLPLLPDDPVDPWGAVDLQQLWLLALLISGLSMAGYVATRWLGPGRGIAVTGLAGGLASSTAVTLAFVRQSRDESVPARQLAGGILIAWSVMFGRVVVAATIVSPALFAVLIVPFAAMLIASAVAAVICLGRREHGSPAAELTIRNPFSLWSATKFAALFAGVQLLVELGQRYLPQGGVYAIAAVAGLTDVDAITLSMAERARADAALGHSAVVAIVIATVSNTLVKAGMATVMGRRLARPVLTATGAILAVGGVALAFA